MKKSLLLIICLILGVAAAWGALTATEIVKQSDEKMRGKTSYVEMTMKIIRPSWTRSMTMKSWSKGTDYSLVLVLSPAREKGTSSLKRGREMWNWVPRIERIIKIAPSMLSQSWMGSDFTNDDLINESSIVVDYTHKILRTETYDNESCWVIEAIPKPNAPVVWGKLILWISQSEFNQRKVEFYDEFGDLVNTLSTHDIQTLGGRRIPTRLIMQPSDKPDQRTVITYEKAQFDFNLPESFFSLSQMKEIPQ